MLEPKQREKTESERALYWLAVAILVGPLSAILYAASQQIGLGRQAFLGFLAVASTGLLLAAASVCAGGVLGFLFGIPRTLQQEGSSNSPERRTDYLANTNLEQISDWLTKILVGIGLTQIPAIRDAFVSLRDFAGAGLGGSPSSALFAAALIVYSVVLGFLFSYLWARLFLVGALRLADQAAIGQLVSEVQKVSEKAETTERQLDELKKQTALDAEALSLAYRQMNPSTELAAPPQEELNGAVLAASRPVKVQIFNQAWQLRGDNWRDPATKPKMELTIPIFRALISSDVDNTYHMNHGQLGFALKDKVEPDWEGAAKELTTAIEMRGPWQEAGWLFYEFNRAICFIMSDRSFAQDLPSVLEVKERVIADLHVATQNDEVRKLVFADSTIRRWMQVNKVTQRDIRRSAERESSAELPASPSEE